MHEFDFTGDLTHTTDDPAARRGQMSEFKEFASKLKVKTVRFMSGEHDASLDRDEANRNFPAIFITASITVEAKVK